MQNDDTGLEIGRKYLRKQKFKRGVEGLIYGVYDSLVLAMMPPRPTPERIAIVHLELLGDMAMWLPYAQALLDHLKSESKEVIIVTDTTFLPLAALAFQGARLVGLAKSSFIRSPLRRAHFLLLMRQLGCAFTLNPSYPRDGIVMDAVVHALGAPAVGFDSVLSHRPAWDRALSNRFYTRLLPRMQGKHQFERYRFFLEAISVDASRVAPAQLNLPSIPPIGVPYWLLAPGSSREFRRWPVERFVEVGHPSGSPPSELAMRARRHESREAHKLYNSPGTRPSGLGPYRSNRLAVVA